MGKFLLILGRGVGQVMFQNNALSGALMLVGILLNSWQMALLAVAGNIVGTLAAYLSGYSREDIENGLYGFNGPRVSQKTRRNHDFGIPDRNHRMYRVVYFSGFVKTDLSVPERKLGESHGSPKIFIIV